jgi:AcrR family transcriptional regulator
MRADVNTAVDTTCVDTAVDTTGVDTTCVDSAGANTAVDTAGAGSGQGPALAPRRPGRPRSERAEQAIIEAALALFAESGVEGLCIERVAARAGVGKATIYRRWPGKEDLLLDALAALKTPLPEPGGNSVREDLIALLEAMSVDIADPRRTREFALLLGEGHKYPRLLARYEQTVVEPRREVFRQVLRRGAASGELRADIDVDAALFMLVGAVMVRGRYEPEVISPQYAQCVVEELLRGLSPR